MDSVRVKEREPLYSDMQLLRQFLHRELTKKFFYRRNLPTQKEWSNGRVTRHHAKHVCCMKTGTRGSANMTHGVASGAALNRYSIQTAWITKQIEMPIQKGKLLKLALDSRLST